MFDCPANRKTRVTSSASAGRVWIVLHTTTTANSRIGRLKFMRMSTTCVKLPAPNSRESHAGSSIATNLLNPGLPGGVRIGRVSQSFPQPHHQCACKDESADLGELGPGHISGTLAASPQHTIPEFLERCSELLQAIIVAGDRVVLTPPPKHTSKPSRTWQTVP
jgi:hypothetical protein